MKINDTTPLRTLDRTPPTAAPAVARPPVDRVSTDQSQQAQSLIETAKTNTSAARPEKLARLEALIKNGTYHPEGSQIAKGLLDAAELDGYVQTIARD